MDWKNIDMQSGYERAQNLLENYTFETLLLECSTNLKEINSETVRAQAMQEIKNKYEEALQVLSDNLENITAEAVKQRAIK
jgi:cyclopropane fatty-acyl-phospholipid synthase-like methyltransferase